MTAETIDQGRLTAVRNVMIAELLKLELNGAECEAVCNFALALRYELPLAEAIALIAEPLAAALTPSQADEANPEQMSQELP